MNHLFHIITAGDDPELITGSIMGDFVKGRLPGGYRGNILTGLRLHRGVDSFAAANEHWRGSRERLSPRFGLYRGVLVDLFYDHFLARRWDEFSVVPYSTYLEDIWRGLATQRGVMPEGLWVLLPRMFEEWLPVYPEVAGIGEVLQRMSRRIARANPLAEGVTELRNNYEVLEEDFRKFYPAVMRYAAAFLAESAVARR